jgi:hypothetical protein
VFSALMGEKPAAKEKESDTSPDAKSEGMPSERRQQLMRQLSREVSQESERDAEYEADKGRERSRGCPARRGGSAGAQSRNAPDEAGYSKRADSLRRAKCDAEYEPDNGPARHRR